jgi:hypothetical protein
MKKFDFSKVKKEVELGTLPSFSKNPAGSLGFRMTGVNNRAIYNKK